jgi:general secretion pathway protein D
MRPFAFVLVVFAAGVGTLAETAASPLLTATTAVATAGPSEQRQAQSASAMKAPVSERHRRAAGKLFLAGAKAIEKNEPHTAERYFLRAHRLDPNNQHYPLSTEVAGQFVVTQLAQRAEREKVLEHETDASRAIGEPMRDPGDPIVTGNFDRSAQDAPTLETALPTLRNNTAAPIALAAQNADHAFHLHADERSLIPEVLNAYGIRATIDSSVLSRQVHFDTDAVDFHEAADLVKLATNTFFVPLDSLHVFVAADTKENRSKYEPQSTETFYFPGLSNTELADMRNVARNIFVAERIAVDLSHSTVTVRVPEPDAEALNEVYAQLLGGHSVLQLEVRLYEIDKTKATNVGLILPTSTTIFNVPSEVNSILSSNASLVDEILKSDPALAGNYEAILAALIASGALTGTVFNSPFAVFGGGLTETGLDLSGVSVNMLLNSSDARSLNQLELRVLDQEDATIRSGARYPIMTSSFATLGSSSSSSRASVPLVQYEDLGLTLKVRPHVGLDNDVSLNLDLKLSSLEGASLNDIPILTSRQYTGVVSLRQGASALLVSDLSKQESREITGVPGLSDIPGFSGATDRQDTNDLMELAIMITPEVVRLAHPEQRTFGPMLLLPHK